MSRDQSDASSAFTAATTTVVLPSAVLGKPHTTEEDEIAAPYAQMKKDIPLANPTVPIPAHYLRDDFFGWYEKEQEADTVRQLLFRGDKRRRYCIIVGDLQSTKRQVTLKLFGHRGLKPFKLQNKLIRLINLSIGKPRVRRDPMDGTSISGAQEPYEEDEEEAENESHDVGDGLREAAPPAAGSTATAPTPIGADATDESTASPPFNTGVMTAEELDANAIAARLLAAGLDDEDEAEQTPKAPEVALGDITGAQQSAGEEEAVSSLHRRAHAGPGLGLLDRGSGGAATATSAAGGGGNDTETSGGAQQLPTVLPATATTVSNNGAGSAPAAAAAPREAAERSTATTGAGASAANSTSGSGANGNPATGTAWTGNPAEDPNEPEDVDHYFEDEVVPLTVQRADTTTGMLQENSLANSAVLTARYFASLQDYFLREFRYLLSMEDVRAQNVAVNVNIGAAYCCLARHGSYSNPLKHATFGEFVERMNEESMQLYFIKDCPVCVSRAVDMECGALNHEGNLTLVKINFFSNERQSRSVARAVWDGDLNAFRLLDMENVGVTFNWTVFSLDETFVKQRESQQRRDPASGGAAAAPPVPIGGDRAADSTDAAAAATSVHGGDAATSSSSATTAAATGEDAIRNKTVAYPFEVEFRAFRRWKQHADHPAASLAEAILEKLSLAEYNLINHGSSIGYERMDLSHVCEVDYASEDFNVESIVVEHTARAKPQGTDLLVDNTTALFIENFAAARQLKERIAQYGPARVAAMQNSSNNNYMRGAGGPVRGRGSSSSNPSAAGRGGAGGYGRLSAEQMEEALQPTSKLTFFRSRGSTIHWKFKPGCSVEENIAPMSEALRFLHQVLHTANDIERTSARGGAAPDAL